MFSFLKKKEEISDDDLIFLKKIVNELPVKYSYLKYQVNREFILRKEKNEVSGKGTYTLVLNAALESKFANKTLPPLFIIKDIFIWNVVKKTFSIVELDILEGMLAGFKLDEEITSLDIDRIDTSRIKEKNFNNEDASFVKQVLGITNTENFLQLDMNSSFKIEEPEVCTQKNKDKKKE